MAASLVLAAVAGAQGPDSSAARGSTTCWKGRPLPRCDAIAITEIALELPLATTHTGRDPTYGYGAYPDFPTILRFVGGVMWNRPNATARGVVVSFAMDADGNNGGSVEARQRYWRSRSFIDVGAGYSQKLVWIRPPGPQLQIEGVTARGLTTYLALAPMDLIAVTARANLLFGGHRGHFGAAAGVQTGSFGSAIVGGVLAAYVTLLFIALSGGDF
ncbi:MAG TPA: hypothetical protein VKH19_14310 [Gemmatimonadaceae bacterium]|nr:hypothetical protein [Gemmatimonadaceae bacterium]